MKQFHHEHQREMSNKLDRIMMNIPYLNNHSPKRTQDINNDVEMNIKQAYSIDTVTTIESTSTTTNNMDEYEATLPLTPRSQEQQQQRQNIALSSSHKSSSPSINGVMKHKNGGVHETDVNDIDNHTHRKNGGSNIALPLLELLIRVAFSKSFVYIICFIMTGSASYLFTQYLQIPGLQEQINALTNEVNRLSNEIDALVIENDRYEVLNNQFNTSLNSLEVSNMEYNQSNIMYQYLNQRLNNTIMELNSTNKELQIEVNVFRRQNVILQDAIQQIKVEKDQLQSIGIQLENENKKLEKISIRLSNEVQYLISVKEQFNTTLGTLTKQMIGQVTLNNELRSLNYNLTTLITFLSNNDNMNQKNQSYETVSSYLSQQIIVNRNLVLKSLEMMYINRVNNWDCMFYDTFQSSMTSSKYSGRRAVSTDVVDEMMSFVNTTATTNLSTTMIKMNDSNIESRGASRSTPIMIDHVMFPLYIDYINQRLLSDLCLDVTNFQQYFIAMTNITTTGSSQVFENNNTDSIDQEKVVDDITIDQFVSSVYMYVNNALMYYFPSNINNDITINDNRNGTLPSAPLSSSNNYTTSSTESSAILTNITGLTPTDWIDANYDCNNLPKSKLYMYKLI